MTLRDRLRALFGLDHAAAENDDPWSVRSCRARAEQGDTKAQYELGCIYASGEIVPQDDAEAARWLQMAADQGHAAAQTYLGTLYTLGDGVPETLQEPRTGIGWLPNRATPPRSTSWDTYTLAVEVSLRM